MFVLLTIYLIYGDNISSSMLVGIFIMAAIASANLFCIFMHIVTSRSHVRVLSGSNTVNNHRNQSFIEDVHIESSTRVIEDTIAFAPKPHGYIVRPITEFDFILQDETTNINIAVPIVTKEDDINKKHTIIVVENP